MLKEDIDSCFRKFFDRPPTEFEISRLFDCYQTAHMEDGALSFEIKYTADDAQLMANAFECAASAGSMGVAYVAGVLRNFRERGIKTEADRVRWEGERYEVFNS